MDDGIPPMSAYYDVPIKLTDVNDKQTSIDIEPKQIPEERYAGTFTVIQANCNALPLYLPLLSWLFLTLY